MKTNQFPQGMSNKDIKITKDILKRLSKHIDISDLYLVGGLVMKYYMNKAGIKSPDHIFNDIDLVLTNLKSLKPSISKDFMVWHYHPDPTNYYIVLLDPKTGVKLDIFNSLRGINQEEKVVVDNLNFKIAGKEDQYVEIVRDCYRIVNLEGFRNKRHYFDDMIAMSKIVDKNKAQEIWEDKDHEGYPYSTAWHHKRTSLPPKDIQEAYNKSLEYMDKYPERIFEGEYSKREPYDCKKCKEANNIKITPMEEVLEIYTKYH